MIWILFAFLNAFFESIKDVFGKKSVGRVDEYVVAWSLRFFALPILLVLVPITGIPSINQPFWIALFISGCLNLITTILYVKAIKASDLSITIPLVTFTPLFLLITSPLILGEFPNIFGIIGIFLIVFGSYTLNIKQRKKGFLAPFKALLKEKGPRLMLLVAIIWSISANIDKIGIENSSPIFWAASLFLFIAILMLPIMLMKSKKPFEQISRDYRLLIPVGLFSAFSLTFQMLAINLTLVANVISIKRSSAIFAVLWGYLFFKEKGIKERLIGSIIMVAGVLFILLS